MHDLNQIRQLNSEAAYKQGVEKARAEGFFVVAKFTGLHFVGHEQFASAAAAVDYVDRQEQLHGVTYTVLAPLSEAEVAKSRGRDQSEDRLAV